LTYQSFFSLSHLIIERNLSPTGTIGC
jgi:hypothetical protein